MKTLLLVWVILSTILSGYAVYCADLWRQEAKEWQGLAWEGMIHTLETDAKLRECERGRGRSV